MKRATFPRSKLLLALWAGLIWGATPAPARAQNAPPFPHPIHKEQGAACPDCHDAAKAPPKLLTSACANCHEEGKVPAWKPALKDATRPAFTHPRHDAASRCEDCHHLNQQERMVTRPDNHGPTWTKSHAMASEHDRGIPGRDCKSCHAESDCRACHRTKQPASHNGLWRVRTHGVSAQWDHGESCKTCHQVGSCLGCHRTTKPLSHTSGWQILHPAAAAGQASTTCLVCHGRSFCLACHNRK